MYCLGSLAGIVKGLDSESGSKSVRGNWPRGLQGAFVASRFVINELTYQIKYRIKSMITKLQ